MYKSRSICIGLAAVLLVLAPPRTVQADDGPGVVPLGQSVDHRSYAEWTAAWWQWALSYAPDVNPVIDPDGTYSGQGQSGPVWFLAGAFGGTAVRNVTIPQGKYLLLALANSEWDTVPGFQNGLGLPDPLSVEDIRAITSYNLRGMSVTCSIDGDSVEHLDRFRVKSPVFSFNFDPALATAFGYPAPYVRTAVSDGYWLMLQPLDPGSHVIHITANSPVFSMDVTYNITVTPWLPPDSHPFGKTFGEWGAAWQQWVFKTTTENCPVTDTTGERALVGQSGRVYFLAGTFGELPDTPWAAPNPVTRTVAIPEGKTLCIPINNWGLCYPEDLPGVPPEDAVATMYEWLNAFYDNMPEDNLACEVDGAAVPNLRSYRAQSGPFQIYAPAVNVENDLMDYWTHTRPCYPDDPQPWYRYYARGWHLSVSDGYYVMLAPMSAGAHTIHIRTGSADAPFCDVYYNLTVQHH